LSALEKVGGAISHANLKYTKPAMVNMQDSPPEKRGRAVPWANFK
jgi:hypothetical protein